MKISKQERLVIIILLVAVIIGAGIFIFLLPNFNQIETNNKRLDSAKKEYSETEKKLQHANTIDAEIAQAYEDGKNLADAFYDDLTTYEADEIMRQFIARGKDIKISGLAISPMATQALSVSVFRNTEVTYPLKDYSNTNGADGAPVNIDSLSKREKLYLAKRNNASVLAMSDPVTVGVVNVTFTAYSDELQNLHDLVDLIYDGVYDDNMKTPDGKPRSKATYINTVNYQVVEDKEDDKNNSSNANERSINDDAIMTLDENPDTPADTTTSGGDKEAEPLGKYSMVLQVSLFCIQSVAAPPTLS